VVASALVAPPVDTEGRPHVMAEHASIDGIGSRCVSPDSSLINRSEALDPVMGEVRHDEVGVEMRIAGTTHAMDELRCDHPGGWPKIDLARLDRPSDGDRSLLEVRECSSNAFPMSSDHAARHLGIGRGEEEAG
jgi:hypothetical protein